MKRIALFLVTNIAVMLVLSVVASALGANQWLAVHGNGLDLQKLLVFAAIFGMGGSFISLLLSKPMAKWSTGAHVIEQPRNPDESWLLMTVQRQAQIADIGMPEVAIYEGAEPNAFATGASRDHALVAVSTGLLGSMRRDEVEAVLGHEITHVANGDMVTLTLIQGVLNTFVIFAARAIGFVIDRAMTRDGDRSGGGLGYMVTVIVLQMVFGILAGMIVAWFSRQREFRADAGGAHLATKPKMIAALQRLGAAYGQNTLPRQINAFGINGSFGQLFATHPPLEERIERLKASSAVIQ